MSTLCGPSREPGVWAARVFRAALLVTSWWGAAVPKALAQECLAGAVPIGVLVPAGGDFVADCSRPYLLVDAAGGNRSFLVLPPCNASSCAGSNGANMLRCLLENGYACCIHAGDVVQTEAGQYTGALVPASGEMGPRHRSKVRHLLRPVLGQWRACAPGADHPPNRSRILAGDGGRSRGVFPRAPAVRRRGPGCVWRVCSETRAVARPLQSHAASRLPCLGLTPSGTPPYTAPSLRRSAHLSWGPCDGETRKGRTVHPASRFSLEPGRRDGRVV